MEFDRYAVPTPVLRWIARDRRIGSEVLLPRRREHGQIGVARWHLHGRAVARDSHTGNDIHPESDVLTRRIFDRDSLRAPGLVLAISAECCALEIRFVGGRLSPVERPHRAAMSL